jgi:hypothetical protein
MEVTMLLCDAADEVGGKLYVMGGGWTHTGAVNEPTSMALALVISVPWDETNKEHQLKTVLITADGETVIQDGRAVASEGTFEMGRPPRVKQGSALNVPLAFSYHGLTLKQGGYVWEVRINGDAKARTPFWVAQ